MAANGQPGWSPSGDAPHIGPVSSNAHQFAQLLVSPFHDTDHHLRGASRARDAEGEGALSARTARRVARPGRCC